jgi:predicted kinase
MRRYDEHATLAATLDRGELNHGQVLAVARALARFHSEATVKRGRRYGARRVELELDQNIEELLAVTDQHAERVRIRALARFVAAFIGARGAMLDARAETGSVREGHGDLRAEHVLLGEPVRVVDCVEFDAGIRTLDVADDLAFLVMDLLTLGGEHFVADLLDGYGDYGAQSLLFFYALHRALVRAKVLLVRAAQYPETSAAHGHASAQARDLLAVAERCAWRVRRPYVLVVCGAPASGKSVLASALANASGLHHLSSDLMRKRLAGIKPTERAEREHYSEQFSRATYQLLGRQARAEVATRGGALIDATFRARRDRDAFTETWGDAAPLVFVQCVAPAAVLARRALARERDRNRTSDATLEVVMRELQAWEPLDEVPADQHVMLRTDRPVEQIVADLLASLDQRFR